MVAAEVTVLSSQNAAYVVYTSPTKGTFVRLVDGEAVCPQTQEPGSSVIRVVIPVFIDDLHRRSFDRACLLPENVELFEATFLLAYETGTARGGAKHGLGFYDDLDHSTD